MHFLLPNANATRSLGVALGRSLSPGAVILLEGDLGSGKTTLVQGIGEGLGITESIVSPTFTLIHEYLEGRIPLYHIDLYRLQPAETTELFLEAYWQGIEFPPSIVAIEWAERLQVFPPAYLQVRLMYTETEGRQVQLTTVGELQPDVLKTIKAIT
ncbi:MAG: tRNA (adenosine(37)-N6)-threonylcarbamoyltransferase complex ATPase subunit type 1 TsaE [Cyanothece sp. SIO1E1]|nr:tRNA (adenosine(37)-N6)-threonylcarbamoyltransferase complex ATPase subunit type 1 TsaE [Cyanothece sp. SIO1E1]